MSNFIASALKSLSINAKVTESSVKNSSENKLTYKVSEHDLKTRCAPDSSSFILWKDAMKMVTRLPDGVPSDFRKQNGNNRMKMNKTYFVKTTEEVEEVNQLWLTLAKKHLESKNIDLKKAFAVCFSEKNDANDTELGTQIIKDLHRTGCSPFSGDVAEQNQKHLKRVLLGYARWNPNVGYCQGFNMLAAIILEVVEWMEEDALMVMIFLIEEVLPESYFANHLQGLSVDMAVFRDLLRLRLSSLSAHLDKLQAKTQDSSTGHIYEPPLTNVFTMQWFLTLFTNCLPKDTVLRVWDLIFLEGNEVLLRTALAIWDGLADRIMAVDSADEFYCIMGVLTREILEFGLMDANMFLKTICTLAPFPFPQLQELRDSYTYNIQPFTSSWPSDAELQIFAAEADDEDEDDINTAKWYFSNELQWYKKKGIANSSSSFSSIGPGAYGAAGNNLPLSFTNFNTERLTLDISSLKKQYMKLRERQKQAHVILSGAFQNHFQNRRRNSLAVNHLLMGKQPLTRKKSLQQRLVFAEKNSVPKRDSKTVQESRRMSVDKESEEEDIDKKSKSPERTLHRTTPISENMATFCTYPETSSALDSYCDTNVIVCKTKNVNKSNDMPSGEVQNTCSCSSTFVCPLHIKDSTEKPPTINPFPTKRRVGSMKTRASNTQSYRQ